MNDKNKSEFETEFSKEIEILRKTQAEMKMELKYSVF